MTKLSKADLQKKLEGAEVALEKSKDTTVKLAKMVAEYEEMLCVRFCKWLRQTMARLGIKRRSA